MGHSHHQYAHHQLHSRREVLPTKTDMVERSVVMVARSTCTNDSDDGCRKPTVVPTLPIILAVVIPVVLATAVLIYFHRRNVKKLREEDARDKYKSLDFGMDPGMTRNNAQKGPNVNITDMEKLGMGSAHTKGLSMDMATSGPYILPAGMHGSHESLHSLSRSTHDTHDPYRPVTFISNDAASIRSGAPYKHDTGSIYTTSSAGTDRNRMNDGLLKNASGMSKSPPLRVDSDLKYPDPVAVPLSPLNPRTYEALPPPPPGAPKNDALPAPPAPPAPPAIVAPTADTLPEVHEARATANTSPTPLPRIVSQQAVVQSKPNTSSMMSDSSFGEGFQITPPSPTTSQRQSQTQSADVQEPVPAPLAPQPRRPERQSQALGLGVEGLGGNTNRLSMSLRPLPPDDPNENAEQRANRIRSFYKEYFDDSKPDSAPAPDMYNDYYEDYTSEYLDGTVFDPETGSFVVAHAQAPKAPFAQPVTRRAMTPPPRAPPRFRSNTGGRGTHMSGSSAASSGFYPPRNMSSMSGRMPPPKKPLPPPAALSSLPTPSQIKEDTAIFNSIDFAPPVSFRERQNGMRPDSPLGNPRPFSPAFRPASPLVSSYDDLAAMPSPHLLRKSGTFTALDFAPPPRFRDPDSMSDAGSIRSNRSGMSHAGRMAIRNGAYRVSKIPAEMVTTREDLSTQLRPQMSLVAKA